MKTNRGRPGRTTDKTAAIAMRFSVKGWAKLLPIAQGKGRTRVSYIRELIEKDCGLIL